MKDVLQSKNIHLQPEEKVLRIVRKHWFIHLTDSLRVIIIGAVPFVLLIFIAPFVSFSPHIVELFISIWLLAVWLMLFTVWTNYYLDIWIVTDKRVINIDHVRLFSRTTSTLRIERVQDVKVQTDGFFAVMLGFGDLQVQTAGPEAGFYTIEGIPDPADVRNVILEYVDNATDHLNRLTHNTEQRPTETQ